MATVGDAGAQSVALDLRPEELAQEDQVLRDRLSALELTPAQLESNSNLQRRGEK